MFWLSFIYISLGIFLAGSIYKIISIARRPIHLRWELAPVPGEKSKSAYGGSYLENYEWWKKPVESSFLGQIRVMMSEILLFHGVWKHNRGIWLFTYSFHLAVYLLACAAGVMGLAFILVNGFKITGLLQYITTIISYILFASYVLGVFGTIGMILKRISNYQWRSYSSVVTYFNLIILLAVFGSGITACFTSFDYGNEVYAVFQNVITANNGIGISQTLAVHIVSVLIFLIYLPFSFLIHFVAKYFTYHDIRWDDRPMNSESEKKISSILEQPVTWKAAHINGGDTSNWLRTVTNVNMENLNEKKS